MHKIQTLVVVFFLSFFVACSSQPSPNSMPSWVMNPNSDGVRGAVGVAGRTYDQSFSSQRKLAIERALDELSLQTGVDVQLNMQKKEMTTNSKAYVSTNESSNYKTSNHVTAHIQDIWMDNSSKEFYVWMVVDK